MSPFWEAVAGRYRQKEAMVRAAPSCFALLAFLDGINGLFQCVFFISFVSGGDKMAAPARPPRRQLAREPPVSGSPVTTIVIISINKGLTHIHVFER